MKPGTHHFPCSLLANALGALLALFGPGPATSSYAVQRQALRGHVPSAVVSLQPVKRLPAEQRLKLALALPLRNQAGLDQLLAQLYDPASPAYRQWLTPAQFTEAFGPAEADYNVVAAWAKTYGLRVTSTHPNRLLLDVEGSVAEIERALNVTLYLYQHPTEARTFYAPSAEPSLDLSVPVAHIGGLNNYALPRPHLKERPLDKSAPPLPNAGSGPGGTFMASDFRAAYVPGCSLTGAGQAVGLLQFDGYDASDIAYYIATNHLSSVTISNILLDGFNGAPSGNGGEVEVCLDIESVLAMAPGVSKIYVYEAGPSGQWYDILNRMANDNLAKQLSCSWYTPGGAMDATADQIFQQMAAQGQSFFNASGDDDAFCGLIDFPGDTPFITQVGGTTLATAGPAGAYLSETVWNWGDGTGSGGGVSTQYPIPVWQQGITMIANHGSTTMRNVPDVALTADQVYVRANGSDKNVGGTSAAAPLWAGFIALVNQQAVSSGRPSVGFLNPTLCALGKSTSYGATFHDITLGSNTNSSCGPARFPAVTGYDLATGWGTPIGIPLVDALAGPPDPLQISPFIGFAAMGGPGGPFDVTSQLFTLTNVGATTLNWSLNSTSLWLNASLNGGALAPGGTAAVTFSLNAAANNLPPATYSATASFTNLNTGVGQSRMFVLTVLGAPEINAQPASQTVRAGRAANFTVAAIGAPPLSYLWMRNGGPIAGATQASYTANNVQLADSGAQFSCLVSNAYGTVTSEVAVLTVTLNLVDNAGFETGDFTGWGGNKDGASVSSSSSYVYSGAYGAELGAVGSLGYLSQTLTTTTGSNYLISLWLNNVAGESPNEFQVSWNGTVLYDGVNLGVLDWTNLQFLVTASAGSSTLQLGFRNDPDYFGLDEVSVTPTVNRPGAPLIGAQPATQEVGPGSSVTFTVSAFGNAPLSYFWRRDGVFITGATQSSYTTNNVQLADNGAQFSCLVSNAYGMVTSQVAVLTVTLNLVRNGGFEAGDFTGWGGNKDGASVSANSSYTHSGHYGARLGPSGVLGYLSQTFTTTPGSNYLVSLWLDNPSSGPPNEFQVTWNGTVLYDGVNFGVLAWTNLQFLITATNSSSTLQLGFRNDPAYLGLDEVSVTLSTNSLGAPYIGTQPASQIVAPGSSVTFTVGALGAPPLSYLWMRNGGPIAGATQSSYTTNNVQLADSGARFSCLVSNAYGMVTSQVAVLTVAPNVVQNGGFETGDFTGWLGDTADGFVDTDSAFVHSGAYGAELGAIGSLGYLYQTVPTTPGSNYLVSLWLNNPFAGTPNEFRVSWNGAVIYDGVNLDLPGWTNLLFKVTATGTSGILQLGARNDPDFFGVDDVSVELDLSSPGAPFILTQPANMRVLPGSSATFTINASGNAPLSYFWRRDGAFIAGATNSSYTTNNVQLADSGARFSCLVSNAAGTALSANATLTVSSSLVENGGFETGDFSGWGGTMFGASVVAGSGYTHSGTYGARLGPFGALGYLSQTLATTPGSSYLVSLWLDNPSGGAPNEFQVSWNGTVLYDGVNLGVLAWTNLQFLVTANGSSSTLQLGSRDDPNYLGLDDISVTLAAPLGLVPPVVANGTLRLAWNAMVGRAYQVQYRTSLAQGNWLNLGPALTATNSTASASDLLAPDKQRFYRVIQLP